MNYRKYPFKLSTNSFSKFIIAILFLAISGSCSSQHSAEGTYLSIGRSFKGLVNVTNSTIVLYGKEANYKYTKNDSIQISIDNDLIGGFFNLQKNTLHFGDKRNVVSMFKVNQIHDLSGIIGRYRFENEIFKLTSKEGRLALEISNQETIYDVYSDSCGMLYFINNDSVVFVFSPCSSILTNILSGTYYLTKI